MVRLLVIAVEEFEPNFYAGQPEEFIATQHGF
jgi:hypothetical protein